MFIILFAYNYVKHFYIGKIKTRAAFLRPLQIYKHLVSDEPTELIKVGASIRRLPLRAARVGTEPTTILLVRCARSKYIASLHICQVFLYSANKKEEAPPNIAVRSIKTLRLVLLHGQYMRFFPESQLFLHRKNKK